MNAANHPTRQAPLFSADYHVYINHTDAGGIVYHANHLVFFENCRRDWFSKIGINGYFLQNDGGEVQHFVVSQADLKYRQAIYLDEVISVRIDHLEIKPASIVFYQSIHRQQDNQCGNPSAASLLSSAKIVVACVQNQISAKASSVFSTPQASSLGNAPTQTPTTQQMSIRPIRLPETLRDLIHTAQEAHQHS